jgi:hypothetical protein
MGFLCISLDGSTVQLHDSLRSRRACACSEAGFSSQNGDRARVVGYTTVEQPSLVRFLWAKWLNAKDIHKEVFPVYGGECFSRKALHNRDVQKSWMMKQRCCSGRSLRQRGFLVLISVRGWVYLRAIVRLEGLGQLKNSNDLIGNLTGDLPACSIFDHC